MQYMYIALSSRGALELTIFLNLAHSSGVSVSALAITGITFTWRGAGQGEELCSYHGNNTTHIPVDIHTYTSYSAAIHSTG